MHTQIGDLQIALRNLRNSQIVRMCGTYTRVTDIGGLQFGGFRRKLPNFLAIPYNQEIIHVVRKKQES